jgi:hemerythrin-like domain-containing protein
MVVLNESSKGDSAVKATQVLMDEHRVIERVLTALERASTRLNNGQDVYLRFFAGTIVFIKNFADGCHHQKEEGILFPAMIENGLSREAGPVAVMLAEHEEGRRLTQKIRQSLERYQGGDDSARKELANNSLAYTKLLRQHIHKEDNILFPMADKLIPSEQQQQISEAFKLLEHDETGEDVHEKYLGLAVRLESECLR